MSTAETQYIWPLAAVEGVIAGVAPDDVSVSTASKRVVPGAAREDLDEIATALVTAGSATTALDDVVSGAAVQPVDIMASNQTVVSRAA